MARTRRIIRKVQPRIWRGLEDHVWPVQMALLVLGAFVGGIVLAYLPGSIWFWPCLLGLPVLVAGAVVGVQYLGNRLIRRTMQLSLVLAAAFYVVVLVILYHTVILARFWPQVAQDAPPTESRTRASVPEVQFWQHTDDPQQQPDFLAPAHTDPLQPDTQEVAREQVDPSNESANPRSTPSPDSQADVSPSVSLSRAEATSVPRLSESASVLSRQSSQARPEASTSADQVARPTEPQREGPSAQVTSPARQATQADPDRVAAEPDPAADRTQPQLQLTRRQDEPQPRAEDASRATLPRQLADAREVPQSSADVAESPAQVSPRHEPLAAADTPVGREQSASPQADARNVEPTSEPAREVAPALERPQHLAPQEPTLAASPAPTPTQRQRSTQRPDVLPPEPVETPSAASNRSVAQPAPTQPQQGAVERLASQSSVERPDSVEPQSSQRQPAPTPLPRQPVESVDQPATRLPQGEAAAQVARSNQSVPNRTATPAALPQADATADTARVSAPTSAAQSELRPSPATVARQAINESGATVAQPRRAEPAASAATQVARANTNRVDTATPQSVRPDAPTDQPPSRSLTAAPSPRSPQPVESPTAAASDSATGSSGVQPSRLAFERSFDGVSGSGHSANLDTAVAAADSPAQIASGSARRAHATQNTPDSNALAPSEIAPAGRSAATAPMSSATLAAIPTDLPSAPGAAEPGELTASSSAALTQASANADAGAISAAPGSLEVDLGPTRAVSEGGAGRASGGGQPQISHDSDSQQLARTARGGSSRQLLAAAAFAENAAAPADSGGGTPASVEAVTQAVALVRTESGGSEAASGGPTRADQFGPVAEPSAAPQVAASLSRSRVAEAAPGDVAAGGGETPANDADQLVAMVRSDTGGAAAPNTLSDPAAAVDGAIGAAADRGAEASAASGSEPLRPSDAVEPIDRQTPSGGGPSAPAESLTGAPEAPGTRGGGETLAVAQRPGRAELADAIAAATEIGGGTASPPRAERGPVALATFEAEIPTTAGARIGGGEPDGGAVAASGAAPSNLAAGVARRSSDAPLGAEKGDMAIDGAFSADVAISPGDRARSPSRDEGALPADESDSGAPVERSSISRSVVGNATEVDVPVSAGGASGTSDALAASPSAGDAGPMSRQESGGLEVNIDAPADPGGLARVPAPNLGINSRLARRDSVQVQLAADARFRRREIGGPPSTTSSVVAPTEAFRGRTSRNSEPRDGGSPTLPSPETEEAIELGLVFLASQQAADGRWTLRMRGNVEEDEQPALNSDVAATGLALLAFQGAGYTHREHRYQDAVRRGVEYLVRGQKDDGDLYASMDDDSDRFAWLYSHSIAALALCEAYGMTQDPFLREPAQKALDFIVASQNKERGGWRYSPNYESDLSVTGWMMMALKSGELANLEVPPETYTRIERFLDATQASASERHLYRYNPQAPDTPKQRHGREVSQTMTSVGLLMRLYTGWRRDNPHMRKGADYLADRLPELGSRRDPQRDTYYWYYATQVMFHMGGDHWKRWHDRLHPLLVDSQQKQGQWAGSWHPLQPVPDRWGPQAGRIYVTTMNLLSLEVHYRHLPLYEDTAK